MVKEGDLVGLDGNTMRISEILDEIYERASSIVEFSLQWKEIEEKRKLRAIEVDLKESSLMEQIVELEKKEERLKEVIEERERKIGLLEKSITLLLEEKEKENEVKQFMESSPMRLVCEKKEEELEEREKKVELLSKLIDEKSCELDRRVKDFDLKEKVSIEAVAISLKKLEAKEKELRLLDEAVKEKLAGLEKEKEIFEAELKEKAEQIEEKSKFLELKLKKLEEMVNEVEVKQREFQESLNKQRLVRDQGLKCWQKSVEKLILLSLLQKNTNQTTMMKTREKIRLV